MWQMTLLGKALRHADAGKPSLPEAGKAGVGAADPEGSVVLGQQGIHPVAGQPVGMGEDGRAAIPEPAEPAAGYSKPNRPRPVPNDRADVVGRAGLRPGRSTPRIRGSSAGSPLPTPAHSPWSSAVGSKARTGAPAVSSPDTLEQRAPPEVCRGRLPRYRPTRLRRHPPRPTRHRDSRGPAPGRSATSFRGRSDRGRPPQEPIHREPPFPRGDREHRVALPQRSGDWSLKRARASSSPGRPCRSRSRGSPSLSCSSERTQFWGSPLVWSNFWRRPGDDEARALFDDQSPDRAEGLRTCSRSRPREGRFPVGLRAKYVWSVADGVATWGGLLCTEERRCSDSFGPRLRLRRGLRIWAGVGNELLHWSRGSAGSPSRPAPANNISTVRDDRRDLEGLTGGGNGRLRNKHTLSSPMLTGG